LSSGTFLRKHGVRDEVLPRPSDSPAQSLKPIDLFRSQTRPSQTVQTPYWYL
jgi:hypothetical protein